MPEPEVFRDKHGRQVCAGDVLKVYHFRGGPRGKKYYMYKVVGPAERGGLAAFCVSELVTKGFDSAHRCRLGALGEFEIVQGHGPGDCVSFEDRPRVKQEVPRA